MIWCFGGEPHASLPRSTYLKLRAKRENGLVRLSRDNRVMADADEAPVPLARGLWSWSRRHPEWHPGDFGAEVVSFCARDGEVTLLVDPLLPTEDDPAWALLDEQLARRLEILITIPFHVRSAERIRERYGAAVEVTIRGHPACGKRLDSLACFEPLLPGEPTSSGVSGHRIGKPVRQELPLHLPSHDALVFGDAVVGVDGGLRMWAMRKLDAAHERFYRERFGPTLLPLLNLEPERILVTHGESVLTGGTEALRQAIEAPPWYHRG